MAFTTYTCAKNSSPEAEKDFSAEPVKNLEGKTEADAPDATIAESLGDAGDNMLEEEGLLIFPDEIDWFGGKAAQPKADRAIRSLGGEDGWKDESKERLKIALTKNFTDVRRATLKKSEA